MKYDEEILKQLKNEMILTEARARGAKEAYRNAAISNAHDVIYKKFGRNFWGKIVVHFTNGDFIYELKNISWGFIEEEPVLEGRRILKNGRPSKIELEKICGLSYLNNVTKQISNLAKDRT